MLTDTAGPVRSGFLLKITNVGSLGRDILGHHSILTNQGKSVITERVFKPGNPGGCRWQLELLRALAIIATPLPGSVK